MSRAVFSNHCLVLFIALFMAALWTRTTVPAEDEPWGIAISLLLLLLTLQSHCVFLTFSVPPHPSTPSIFRQILQGSDRMGLLAPEHETAACSFQPDFLYLWSVGIVSCIMVQILQRPTTAPAPTTEVTGGMSWCRITLATASTGSTFFWACLWGTVLSVFIGTAVLQVECYRPSQNYVSFWAFAEWV